MPLPYAVTSDVGITPLLRILPNSWGNVDYFGTE